MIIGLVEITALVFYQQFFTGGEIFALITANQYETKDIALYCFHKVFVFWSIYTIICFFAGVWIIKIKTQKKKIIFLFVIALEIVILLPFVLLPLPSNLVREIHCVVRQVRDIKLHKFDSKDFEYNAYQKEKQERQEIYVLAIGESVRYKNISLNNAYERETTPMLRMLSNIDLYSNYYANATLTQHAIPMLLTQATTYNYHEHFYEKSIAAAFSGVGYRTALVSHRAQLMNNGYHDYLAQDFDTLIFVEHDSLIAPIVRALATNEKKLFIVTHYLGNHMFYTNRTDDCLKWRPDYNADPKAKSDSLFLNAYDNSLLYTDKLLSEFVSILDRTNAVCSWLFVSDHGEYISPKVSGHGHTYHPTKDEYHVPLMVWYSDEYKEAYPEKVANMIKHKDEPVSADHVFWSVLDMAGIEIEQGTRSKEQGLDMSVFSDTLLPHRRTLLLPDGKSVLTLD